MSLSSSRAQNPQSQQDQARVSAQHLSEEGNKYNKGIGMNEEGINIQVFLMGSGQDPDCCNNKYSESKLEMAINRSWHQGAGHFLSPTGWFQRTYYSSQKYSF